MKYAVVNEKRQEAQPGLSAKCPGCEAPMLARCGEVNIWHWAHHGVRDCGLFWENETEWHRAWKGQFPEPWQEVYHRADDGEKFMADVKTDQGWVIEFQYSAIKPEERRSRNSFYPKLVWVVDGTRRKRDIKQFNNALQESVFVDSKLPMVKLRGFIDECALLREWAGSDVPIFFDFREEATLWYLLPKSSDGMTYVVKFSRTYFIELLRGGAQTVKDLEFWLKELKGIVSNYNSNLRSQSPIRLAPLPRFQQYLARKERYRRR